MPQSVRLSSCRFPALFLLIALCAPALADSSSGSEEKRVAVAKATDSPGILLSREAGKPWKLVGPGDSIYTRDMLLVLPGARGSFVTNNKAATVELWGNLPQVSDFPVLESAVILHENADFDLDFTLDRGRVLITNSAAKGEVKVKVRARDQVWIVTLNAPGDAAVFELFARMMPGTTFTKPPYDKDNPQAQPRTEVGFFVTKGSVTFVQGVRTVLLTAPPGPARVEWDSDRNNLVTPMRMTAIPPWIVSKSPYDGSPYIHAALDRVAKQTKEKNVDSALASLLDDSANESDPRRAALLRSLAIYGFGAVDDIAKLTEALENEKSPEIRETAIEALRQWIGRAPGRDLEFHNQLVKGRGFEPKQAEAAIALLNGFTDRRLLEPETYELLIGYVKNSHLGIRQLAYWHLNRLVKDNKIKYDPAGPAAERERAFKEWKKLVPDGKLPGATN
jgi:hypothetical protein